MPSIVKPLESFDGRIIGLRQVSVGPFITQPYTEIMITRGVDFADELYILDQPIETVPQVCMLKRHRFDRHHSRILRIVEHIDHLSKSN
ncbi:MAG TPA: hypothetical protein VFE98_10965 [Candidatus Bathyarchaeia archaeon]|nr:hypothetical protein [Candidatus Bathyarchaeia archaeon]